MRLSSSIGVAIACAVACGCAKAPLRGTRTISPGTTVVSRPQPRPEDVLLLQSGAERPCEILGLIDVHLPSGDEEAALAELRRRGAEVGADAVVRVTFEHDEDHDEQGVERDAIDGRWSGVYEGRDPDDDRADRAAEIHVSGVAVRFRDLAAGRRYVAVGRLEIDDRMGAEDDALRRLREAARSAGADLLVGVRFEHDPEADLVRVSGTAVRFVE